jgi:hypothetical protein
MCCRLDLVTSAKFKRWLEKRGCTFAPGKGGHLKVCREGLADRIKKDLGLK